MSFALFVDIAWNASRVVSFRVSHRFTRVERYSRASDEKSSTEAFSPAQSLLHKRLHGETDRERKREGVKEKRKYCFAIIIIVVLISLS